MITEWIAQAKYRFNGRKAHPTFLERVFRRQKRNAFFMTIVLEDDFSCLDTIGLPVAQDFPKRLRYSIEATEL
jgi:hypothetical protein